MNEPYPSSGRSLVKSVSYILNELNLLQEQSIAVEKYIIHNIRTDTDCHPTYSSNNAEYTARWVFCAFLLEALIVIVGDKRTICPNNRDFTKMVRILRSTAPSAPDRGTITDARVHRRRTRLRMSYM